MFLETQLGMRVQVAAQAGPVGAVLVQGVVRMFSVFHDAHVFRP